MIYRGHSGEYIEVKKITGEGIEIFSEHIESALMLLWFTSGHNLLTIDGKEYKFGKDEIICLTEFHQLEIKEISDLRVLRFNRAFYCILNHDSEVGCKGILYFGSSHLPILYPDQEDIEILHTVWKMLEIEMVSRDELQLEMLQMMLKRILILCTRIYKNQEKLEGLGDNKIKLIREFNFLVETHFRDKHSVKEYADLLYKSPKTISNTFRKWGKKSPLQYIQDRIMLAARRELKYSDQSISDIAYGLGFEDLHAFSRFFKRNQGISPSEYKN